MRSRPDSRRSAGSARLALRQNNLTDRRGAFKHPAMRLLTPDEFVPACYPVVLPDEEIHLWYFAPSGPPSKARDPRPARLLAAYVGCAEADLRFEQGEHGKPSLRAPASLEFNLSHSGGALLVAISRSQPLGGDLEILSRQRPGLELARRFFDPAEADALARLEPPRQQSAFLKVWSCKEAVLKALGHGLSFGLARLSFTIDARGEPIALNVIHASAGPVQKWQIIQLAPMPEAVGALAWHGLDHTLRAFTAVDG